MADGAIVGRITAVTVLVKVTRTARLAADAYATLTGRGSPGSNVPLRLRTPVVRVSTRPTGRKQTMLNLPKQALPAQFPAATMQRRAVLIPPKLSRETMNAHSAHAKRRRTKKSVY